MESPRNAPPDPVSLEALRGVEALVDTLPWGVLVLDEQRIVQRINAQAARWCGTEREALLGRPLAGADLLPEVHATLLQLLEPGAAVPREVWLPQLQQWLSLSSTRSRPAG